MKRKEFIRELVKAGCYIKRHGANHDIYMNRRTGRKAPIPRHAEIRVKNALRDLAVPNAIAVLDSSHQGGLSDRVRKTLTLMLGKDQVNQIVTALGGEVNQVDESLRRFLERDFFKAHVKWYRKCPVY